MFCCMTSTGHSRGRWQRRGGGGDGREGGEGRGSRREGRLAFWAVRFPAYGVDVFGAGRTDLQLERQAVQPAFDMATFSHTMTANSMYGEDPVKSILFKSIHAVSRFPQLLRPFWFYVGVALVPKSKYDTYFLPVWHQEAECVHPRSWSNIVDPRMVLLWWAEFWLCSPKVVFQGTGLRHEREPFLAVFG